MVVDTARITPEKYSNEKSDDENYGTEVVRVVQIHIEQYAGDNRTDNICKGCEK